MSPSSRVRLRLLAPVLAAAGAACAIAPAAQAATPFDSRPGAVWSAAGDSSANVPLDASNEWAMLRWVARRDGRISKLWMHVKTEGAVGR
jgi:hypothetical protein